MFLATGHRLAGGISQLTLVWLLEADQVLEGLLDLSASIR